MPLCDIPRARSQTTVAHQQGPHRFEGNDTELPLGSTMKQNKKECHFALRESTIMLAWMKGRNIYVKRTSFPEVNEGCSVNASCSRN
jgi:hypothetical protein